MKTTTTLPPADFADALTSLDDGIAVQTDGELVKITATLPERRGFAKITLGWKRRPLTARFLAEIAWQLGEIAEREEECHVTGARLAFARWSYEPA